MYQYEQNKLESKSSHGGQEKHCIMLKAKSGRHNDSILVFAWYITLIGMKWKTDEITKRNQQVYYHIVN